MAAGVGPREDDQRDAGQRGPPHDAEAGDVTETEGQQPAGGRWQRGEPRRRRWRPARRSTGRRAFGRSVVPEVRTTIAGSRASVGVDGRASLSRVSGPSTASSPSSGRRRSRRRCLEAGRGHDQPRRDDLDRDGELAPRQARRRAAPPRPRAGRSRGGPRSRPRRAGRAERPGRPGGRPRRGARPPRRRRGVEIAPASTGSGPSTIAGAVVAPATAGSVSRAAASRAESASDGKSVTGAVTASARSIRRGTARAPARPGRCPSPPDPGSHGGRIRPSSMTSEPARRSCSRSPAVARPWSGGIGPARRGHVGQRGGRGHPGRDPDPGLEQRADDDRAHPVPRRARRWPPRRSGRRRAPA